MDPQSAQIPYSQKCLVLPTHFPLSQPTTTHQHALFDLTSFSSQKHKYLLLITSIKDLRVAQHLCKFHPPQKKSSLLLTYNQLATDLCLTLQKLTLQAENFRSRFECSQKFKVIVQPSVKFLEFVQKEMKGIREAWKELLTSVKRIPFIVKVLGVEVEVVDVGGIDMYEWERGIEEKFMQLGGEEGKGRNSKGCCSRWR